MGRMVMIAGAGDAAGLRLTKEFLKAGDTVIAGLLTGQDAAALPEGMESRYRILLRRGWRQRLPRSILPSTCSWSITTAAQSLKPGRYWMRPIMRR